MPRRRVRRPLVSHADALAALEPLGAWAVALYAVGAYHGFEPLGVFVLSNVGIMVCAILLALYARRWLDERRKAS